MKTLLKVDMKSWKWLIHHHPISQLISTMLQSCNPGSCNWYKFTNNDSICFTCHYFWSKSVSLDNKSTSTKEVWIWYRMNSRIRCTSPFLHLLSPFVFLLFFTFHWKVKLHQAICMSLPGIVMIMLWVRDRNKGASKIMWTVLAYLKSST